MYAITWKVTKAGGWPDRSGTDGEFAGYIMESGVEEIFLSYKSSGKCKGAGQWAKSGDEVTSCMVFDNAVGRNMLLNTSTFPNSENFNFVMFQSFSEKFRAN